MPPRSVTLPRALPPSLDVDRLYAQGVTHAQRLSGRVWTDFNVHDPGVTALELLCHALTELAYRLELSTADLLTSGGEDPAHSTLHTAARVLTHRALTVLDTRKLLIDLPGVRNAWLLPAELEPAIWADTTLGTLGYSPSDRPEVRAVKVRGLYRVLLDLFDGQNAAERAAVVARAEARLHANRNLCEDFVGVDLVPVQPFNLCAEVELEPQADPVAVHAAILFGVDRVLSPPVFNYTLDELLARTHADGTPWTVEEIFDGPALDCGFIDSEELRASELKRTIFLSDILSVIQDIPGVRAIRDAVFSPSDPALAGKDRWRVPVREGHRAAMNVQKSRLVFYKRSTPMLAHPDRVHDALRALKAAERAHLDTPRDLDLPVPTGRVRDTSSHESVQNSFPPLYGLSEASVPVDPRRQLLARQLKAYLLHFEQLLADQKAALGAVGRLLSADPAVLDTRVHSLVHTLHEHQQIYADASGLVAALGAADRVDDPEYTRRGAVLDHLLARFGEDLADQLAALRTLTGMRVKSAHNRKCRFLSELPEVQSGASLGYNRSLTDPAQIWNTHNVSGLERRLEHLLALDDPRRRNLSSVAYDLYAQIDSTPGDQHRFRVRHAVTGEILLSSSTFYATPELARAELRVAIERAKEDDAYARHQTHGGDRWYFNVVDTSGEVVARRIEYFRSAEALDEAIEQLKHYVRTWYSDEGLYVIETLLLRPQALEDPLLPICPEPECTDCTESDPYSYRVHIVLPAYGRRFQDMSFRALVEDTIRAEVPAHILPRICWASADDMAALERPYREWLELLARGGTDAHRREVLQRLITALFHIRNVYPTRALTDCEGAAEGEGHFILGENALGTGPNRTNREG